MSVSSEVAAHSLLSRPQMNLLDIELLTIKIRLLSYRALRSSGDDE